MHILLIHQAFASLDEPGGTRHHEFARHMAVCGHRVTVITSPVSYLTGRTLTPSLFSSSPPPKRERGNVPQLGGEVCILHAYTYSALHKSFIHRTIAFFSFMVSSFFIGLGVKDVDVVWGTSPPIFQGVTAWTLARLKRTPFLFEVRDLWPAFAIAIGVLRNPILICLSEWLERFLYRHAERVVVNSPGFITHVMQREARRVELIPNGTDPSMFDPTDGGVVFRRTHHLENKFVVLYAGAHGISNDLSVVLEAAHSLAGRPGNLPGAVHIVLLGDGKEKPNLQHQAARMGLTNVTFLSPVPKKNMSAALAGADACIAILKPLEAYRTTYPNKVFDYMAAGRPVALAIDGVIREVVEAAECGLFAEPGNPEALADSIEALAVNPEHSRKMGLNGRRYVETHFSRAILAERLVCVLEEMVKSG